MTLLHRLKVGDRFYFEGKKYSVFIKPKRLPVYIAYVIHCVDYPNPDEIYRLSPAIMVKPVVRV